MDTIGERIRFIRKKNGLKQEEFAKDLSVSRSFISRIESNKEKAFRYCIETYVTSIQCFFTLVNRW